MFFSFLGLSPCYDFEQRRLVRPKLYRCYATTVALFLLCLSLWQIYLRYCNLYNRTISISMLSEITLEFGILFTIILTILGATYWNRPTWIDLYLANNRLYTSKQFVAEAVKKTLLLRYDTVIFVTANVYISCFILLNIHVIREHSGHAPYYFVTKFLLHYYKTPLSYVIINMTVVLKCRYASVNELFKACSCFKSRNNFVKSVREIKGIWMENDEKVQYFNRLFGWPILSLFFIFVLWILNALIDCAAGTYKFDTLIEVAHVYHAEVRVVNAGSLLLTGFWLTAIIFCCDSVVREAEKLLTNCYKLEQTLPLLSKELEELESLKKLIKNKTPKLTAAGFFEIRRSTLLSLLSTTTTYFIVALQFNSVK
ncbi:hypothetical protein NQ315_011461 [Exocentrus adspersus]|uniref:Gustatory receptor n=1 Tax=Exocentrus adspersus TaxID=1586481 RepID=A0AAV8VUQ2_9CUCU|nr:hypothetical protein NQ315_011461 [Exocentrus adspersus]